jgi:hypothetical protein
MKTKIHTDLLDPLVPKKKRGNPKFQKGVNAYPDAKRGRPPGTVNKMTLLARQMMTDRGPMVVEKVIDMALEGDVHCLKMCLDRILPSHKAIDSNRTKTDTQIVINVGASADIQAKINETPQERLVNPETKDDEAVIIEVEEVVK